MTYTDEEVKTVIAEFEKEYTDFLRNEFGDDPDKFWANLDEAGRKQVWVEWCFGGKSKAVCEFLNHAHEHLPTVIFDEVARRVSAIQSCYVYGRSEFLKTSDAMQAQRRELQKQIFINGVWSTANQTSVIGDFSWCVEIATHLDCSRNGQGVMYWFDEHLIVESHAGKVGVVAAQVWDVTKPDGFGNYPKKNIIVKKLEKGDPAFASMVDAYARVNIDLVEKQKMFKQLVG